MIFTFQQGTIELFIYHLSSFSDKLKGKQLKFNTV